MASRPAPQDDRLPAEATLEEVEEAQRVARLCPAVLRARGAALGRGGGGAGGHVSNHQSTMGPLINH